MNMGPDHTLKYKKKSLISRSPIFNDFHCCVLLFLYILLFTSLSMQYRSYQGTWFYRQRKPVHTVDQDSVL